MLTEGKDVALTADDDYVKRSIHNPPKEVAKGFAPQMPKADLSDRDVADLIAYIKSLVPCLILSNRVFLLLATLNAR